MKEILKENHFQIGINKVLFHVCKSSFHKSIATISTLNFRFRHRFISIKVQSNYLSSICYKLSFWVTAKI